MIAELSSDMDFKGWRTIARSACSRSIPPENIIWQTPTKPADLFAASVSYPRLKQNREDDRKVVAPKTFLEKAERVVCLGDPEGYPKLYRLLWRYQEDRHLFARPSDPDVSWLNSGEKVIRRDIHKMHAFVRFRKVGETEDGREQFVSWFEPTYPILHLTAPFFRRRFANMDWSIVTPASSVHWNGKDLRFSEGGRREDVPAEDALEDDWKVYFASIFNPARLKVSAMTSEMPKKYWKNLPEAELIPSLIQSARSRSDHMTQAEIGEKNPLTHKYVQGREDPVSATSDASSLADLQSQASRCNRCDLAHCASQTVFGEGSETSKWMIVGEQPGDQEDIQGRPFVGPAGKLLDQCLEHAGLSRQQLYITNAVKHFRFEPRGKRRLHKTPSVGHIDACRWWLVQERKFVKPKNILAMGATAARSILGHQVSVNDARGRSHLQPDGSRVFVTVHPSYLLRLTDPDTRRSETDRFIEDLKCFGE